MAKKVTCNATKEKGTSDIFFKAPDEKWYKDETTYVNYCAEKSAREEVTHLLLDYIGYQKGEPFPALLNKKLKEYTYYPMTTMLATLKKCDKSIQWAMNNKNFGSTTGKIFYIFAVVSNHIGDMDREIKTNSKRIRNVVTEPPIDNTIEMSNIGTSIKGKDISSFLED